MKHVSCKLIIQISILLAGFIIPCDAQKKLTEPLVIFHLDLNSVSLREDYLREWLKKAADMGYNAVLWEVENEIQWKTCPECASPDAFTKAEFREILAYSRELGLEPIPLLQTIGHAEYVLQIKKYFKYREDPNRYDCYCTSSPAVRTFLKKWVVEYLDLFGDIRYFHLGGDEAYAFATCPACSARVAQNGQNQLYTDHMLDIAGPILKRGIRPGVWCDMIMAEPATIDVLPKDFVIWDWNYWEGDSIPERVMVWGQDLRTKEQLNDETKQAFPEIMDENGNLRSFYTTDVLKRFGYDVVLCSGARTYGDGVFAGEHEHHAPNIVGAARKTAAAGILGNCVTSWAIRIHNFETQEAWLYLAPLTIKNPEMDYDNLLRSTSKNLLGIDNTEFFKAITLIGQSIPFANNKTTGIQWTNLKDSRPAPPGFIADLVTKWKATDNQATWQGNAVKISAAEEKILQGINQLNGFIPDTKSGYQTLNAWSKAGYFQYWADLIAQEIIATADGTSSRSAAEMVELIQALRQEYMCWAMTWMTPASAEINTGLIYDAIIDYFKNCCRE